MSGCKHETLLLGDDDVYACGRCGLSFLVERAPDRIDRQPAPEPQRDPASEQVDVSGRVRFYVEAQSGAVPASSRQRKQR